MKYIIKAPDLTGKASSSHVILLTRDFQPVTFNKMFLCHTTLFMFVYKPHGTELLWQQDSAMPVAVCLVPIIME